jgi:hypothetical protein
VYSSAANFVIDPELLVLRDGTLMIFATEMMGGVGDAVAFVIHVFGQTTTAGRGSSFRMRWLVRPFLLRSRTPGIRAPEWRAAAGVREGRWTLASRLEQIRSWDGGLTWEQPT